MAAQSPDAPSPLLALPSELRLIIYDFIFESVSKNEDIKLLEYIPYEKVSAAFWCANHFSLEMYSSRHVSEELKEHHIEILAFCSSLKHARLQRLIVFRRYILSRVERMDFIFEVTEDGKVQFGARDGDGVCKPSESAELESCLAGNLRSLAVGGAVRFSIKCELDQDEVGGEGRR